MFPQKSSFLICLLLRSSISNGSVSFFYLDIIKVFCFQLKFFFTNFVTAISWIWVDQFLWKHYATGRYRSICWSIFCSVLHIFEIKVTGQFLSFFSKAELMKCMYCSWTEVHLESDTNTHEYTRIQHIIIF